MKNDTILAYRNTILLIMSILYFCKLLSKHHLNLFMEFNTDELDKVIMKEENKSSIDIHSTNSSLSTTIKNEPMATNNNGNREYCLVIFNNPRWSRCLRKKSTHVRKTKIVFILIN